MGFIKEFWQQMKHDNFVRQYLTFRQHDMYTRMLPVQMLIEFNNAALQYSVSGKDLSVEQTLVSKALTAYTYQSVPDVVDKVAKSLALKTATGHFEHEYIEAKLPIHGEYYREPKFSSKGSREPCDRVIKHIALISRPDLISEQEKYKELKQITNQFNLVLNFSVENGFLSDLDGNRNKFVDTQCAYYKSTDQDVNHSCLILRYTRQ